MTRHAIASVFVSAFLLAVSASAARIKDVTAVEGGPLGAEAQDLLGAALEIAVVKNATGRYAAQCLPLTEARERICEAAARAVSKLRAGQAPAPFRLAPPIRLAIEFMDTQQVDRAFLMPGTERASGTRLEFTAPDMVTAHRALRAMVMLARD